MENLNRTIQLIMPMAGHAQRFKDAGVLMPKPLIPIGGRALFRHAYESLSPIHDRLRAFVVALARDDELHGLSAAIRKAIPGAEITLIPKTPAGPVLTCLTVRGELDSNLPLVILDCDLSFRNPEFVQTVLDPGGADGALNIFPSTRPHYSYVQLRGNRVTKIAEKKVVSENAVAGAYFFRSAGLFLDAALRLEKHAMRRPEELFVSDVYRALIDSGKTILASRVSEFASYGTPEELAIFGAS